MFSSTVFSKLKVQSLGNMINHIIIQFGGGGVRAFHEKIEPRLITEDNMIQSIMLSESIKRENRRQ